MKEDDLIIRNSQLYVIWPK